MPDETYRILYEAMSDKAIRSINALIAAHVKLDAQVDKSVAKLKAMGDDTSGIAKVTAALAALDAELKSKVVDAAAAEKALKGVGRGNSAVAALTKKLASLQAQIASLQAAAATATPVVAGVGSGSTVGTAGGGGGAGGGRVGPGGILTAGLGRHLAYATFRKAVGAAGASVADRREHFAENAEMASQYRKDLKELAVLQGKAAPDEDLIREDLAFQKQTKMNPEMSRTFRLEFGGAIAPSLDARGPDGQPNITPKVAGELEVEAARFTARYGLDPTTGGRLAGLLGKTQKVPDAKSGLATLAETMEQLNIKGVGPVRTLAPQLLTLSGGMLDQVNEDSEDGEKGGGGRFKSYPEMAARFAATTASQAGSGYRAKTRIVQSDRLLRKLAYDRKSTLGQSAGITQDDDYETAIRKLARVPGMEGPGADRMLVDSKYKNSTERLAVVEAIKNNRIVDANMEQARKSHATMDPSADNRAYAGSIAGRQQDAENSEFAARIESGLAGERLKAARTEQRARMIRSDTLKAGPIGRLADMGISATTLGGISGEDMRVDTAVIDSLQRRGEAAGVDVLSRHPKLDFGPRLLGMQDEKGLASEFDSASREVEAAELLKRGGALIQQGAAKLGRGQGQGGAAPPPPGNGGAGFNPGRP